MVLVYINNKSMPELEPLPIIIVLPLPGHSSSWMSTIENESFIVLEEISLELHMWWNNLGEINRKTVIKALGDLVGLLKIKSRKDIIEALIPFWDPAHNVFHFADFELTRTLEEIEGYAGFSGNLRNQYPVAPRTVTQQ
uniref:Uncharacterized protein LOC104248484 isoform X2 n=1 Tax=Nicotiana sylvestris TaxID=4096 RepID=A0A1U7YIU5_NICSY|nr:PREDICTED: uncharacterized protein LOC104248484 isoform X2 [Nicotiana sylvestris]